MATEKRLIDANALTDLIIANFQAATWDGASSEECQLALDTIDEAETVDAVEVVHGRWVKDGDVVVCSNCGEEHAWEEYRATYCEDCGAKMDGDENARNI